MVGVTGALIGAAAIGAGASIIGGNKAAKAQKQAADTATAETRRQYDTTRADFEPWRTTGQAALGKLAGLYGVGGTSSGAPAAGGMSGAYGGFETTPGYAFRRDEATKAIERSAASKGLLRSGASVKAIARYTDGLATSEFQNYADRLAQLAGVGQSATQSTAAAGEGASARIGDAYLRAGDARASSYANVGATINNTATNLASAYLYNQGQKVGSVYGAPPPPTRYGGL